MRCAVVRSDGTILNVIEADPATDIAPQDCSLIIVPDGLAVDITWTMQGNEFVAPSEQIPEGNI